MPKLGERADAAIYVPLWSTHTFIFLDSTISGRAEWESQHIKSHIIIE